MAKFCSAALQADTHESGRRLDGNGILVKPTMLLGSYAVGCASFLLFGSAHCSRVSGCFYKQEVEDPPHLKWERSEIRPVCHSDLAPYVSLTCQLE